jgi:Do/DeqQ family serine protease
LPSGVGSGVLVSPDGYIITNNHVVDGADKVEVTLPDKREFTAKVIGADPPTDVAIIKIEGGNFPTIPFGDSDQVEVGDIVLAVGNPLGIGQSVSMGIISAKGRQSRAGGADAFENFLQTDAAINRGNSGGALVNLKGELIGVPSQILSQSGGNIGIGFAIPTEMARSVMDQLIRKGKVTRGMLGIEIRPFSQDEAEAFSYKGGAKGALVERVTPGLPADQAGVKRGDIVTEFQGQRIEDSTQLRNLAAQTAPGTTVKFKVWRDGAEKELSAKIVERDLDKAATTETGEPKGEGNTAGGVLSGVRVETLTPELAQRLRLPATARGVVITEIADDSNAAAAGLRRGDVIEEVARQPITNLSDFNAAMAKVGKKSVLLSVRSGERVRFVLVKAQE